MTSSKDCLASLSRVETVILSAAESCIESPKRRDEPLGIILPAASLSGTRLKVENPCGTTLPGNGLN